MSLSLHYESPISLHQHAHSDPIPVNSCSATALPSNIDELIFLANFLADDEEHVSSSVEGAKSCPFTLDKTLIQTLRLRILAGQDPLGDKYCELKNGESRRPLGQTFTPRTIVKAMLDWSGNQSSTYDRIVDPGSGTGRFTIAALKTFPAANAICIEADPNMALILKANLKLSGLSDRAKVVIGDFRDLKLPKLKGKTLFIGNPPYVRHHDISPKWKNWYSKRLESLGHHSSKLAGLHLHFFVKTLELAKEGDECCYITAAEWLDVNYGQALRDMLCNGLGGKEIYAVAPTLQVFDNAMVTAAITCFSPGKPSISLAFKSINSVEELANLRGGLKVALESAKTNHKWSALFKPKAKRESKGMVSLGELFRVHRGQVTGLNKVWVVPENAPTLPDRFLVPCITKAKDLTSLKNKHELDLSNLKRVANLPASLEDIDPKERKQVERFINWAKKQGAAEGYIATHRKPWWRINLKEPAPIVMTYMGRRSPVFVRNNVDARLINVAHGLYPRESLPDEYISRLIDWLNANVTISAGRVYSGGLVKYEPSEVMQLRIPSVTTLLEKNINELQPSSGKILDPC